jgi:hypothetical protein
MSCITGRDTGQTFYGTIGLLKPPQYFLGTHTPLSGIAGGAILSGHTNFLCGSSRRVAIQNPVIIDQDVEGLRPILNQKYASHRSAAISYPR